MKTILPWTFLFLLGLSPLLAEAPRHHIEGRWQAETFQVAIEIREDQNGIQIRRTDENRWYLYDFVGNGTYKNHQGDRYRLWNEDQLVFTNDRKGQQIRFYRSQRNEPPTHRSDNFSKYRKNIDYMTAAKLLEGRWRNRATRERVLIDRQGRDLLVRFDGWTRTFRPSYDGYFEDRRGSRIKLMENQSAVLDLVGLRRPLFLEWDGSLRNNRGQGRARGW